MKRIICLFLLIMTLTTNAQTDWSQFDKLMREASYTSAYAMAEGIYNKWKVESGKKKTGSREALLAAYNMTLAASNYQEDVRDSAEVRYRSLLPLLEPLEKALCHAFLGEYDSAFVYSDVLKATPVEQIKQFCNGGKGENMTPTAYDVVVTMMQDRGELTPQQRVEWQQRLCDFHASDANDGLRIWHDRRLLDFMETVPNHPVKLSIYQQYINKYRDTKSAQVTTLYEAAARQCQQEGDLVQAVRYCDTAISLFPKSEWGVQCANLRSGIVAPRINLSRSLRFMAPQREELMGVEYANLDRLHLRIIDEPEKYMNDEQLAKLKPLREWTVDVPRPDAYGEASAAFALPPLPTGKYRLLAAPTSNFGKGMAHNELHVTDIALRYTNDGRGLVVNRTTGAPVAGQQVQLVKPRDYRNQQERVLQTVFTASDGTYRFDSIPPHYSIVRIVRDGYTIIQSAYSYANSEDEWQSTRFHLVSDRPVYHPGDTVQLAVVLYRSDGRNGELLADGHSFELTLIDPNGQPVQQLTLTTDDFGSAHCALPLPTDRLAGQWLVSVSDSTGSGSLGLRIEEYKQPRFMVSLNAEGDAPQFGNPYTVQGMAAAYSGVSLGGARVQYTVTRSQRIWRWGPSRSTEVAQGETETAADGTFIVVFTPEPDSSVELSTKPVFTYTVQVTVTDLNGESHNAETTLRVGYQHLFVYLKEIGANLRELRQVQVELTDINGTPQQGRVEVSVERLHRPESMRLVPVVLTKEMHMTIDSADYHRRFPQYIYDMKENDRRQWSDEWHWTGIIVDGKVELPPLQGGIYRIVAWTKDGENTVSDTAYTVLTPAGDKLTRTDAVLWVDQDKTTAHPGEHVTFRLGSAFEDVKAFYKIEYSNSKTLKSGWLTLGKRLQELTVDVDSAQLGGLTLTVVTMLHGQSFTESRTVEVPYSHKELKVEIASFRDKLQPGETEVWTISVKSGGEESLPTAKNQPSTLILTMYDDALNTYGTQSWGLWPWRGHSTLGLSLYAPYLSYSLYNGSTWRGYNGSYPSVWSLKDALPAYNRWNGRMMYKTAVARNSAVVTELAVVEEDAVLDAVQPQAAGDMGAAEEKVMEEKSILSDVDKEPELQLRTNLSTLAFFAPALHSDESGMVTYRFTVPELLTRWNVRGLAITKDLKTGTLNKTLVTAKPLMVQPNMPRFLRSGDSLSLMAKVVMSEELRIKNEEKPVDVEFLLTDAATGDTLCHSTERVLVKDAAQVMFDVEVPQNVYVATYKIVAHAEGMSDGEQGQVPVVTNRQAVTISQALYINGVGEKHFNMPEWRKESDTREPQLLVAELTSNPVWLAVKSMPYLDDLGNPSTPYLAEQLYINGMGRSILDKLDILTHPDVLDKLEENKDSRLRMNEDVKNTLLQVTPWVRAAESEEEQMQAIRHYFDSNAMEKQHATLLAQLTDRQNADGGWSWMPDVKSSVWVTQQVLRLIVNERLNTKKALDYLDREHQLEYEKWIKPILKRGYAISPINIDYLYTRSFYGKASTEAHKFYYSNALNSYKNCENLYSQAQLALIFYRHGDKKQSLDLLRRLKEKSLCSDEMGTYWRDNVSGWYWYSRPIETQALIIQAFAEITPDDTATIGKMQQWLLKQKQTTHWGTSRATTEAINALTALNGSKPCTQSEPMQLSLFGTSMNAKSHGLEGYSVQRWNGAALDSVRMLHSDDDITIRKHDRGIAWGAVYYQFTDDMDKIPHSEMGIKVRRTYLGPKVLHVGDRVKVRVDIQCDRAMDYLELVDGRPSCVEPLSTRAGWRWNDGLSYYITVDNTTTRCYVEHLDKGKYWFEYEVFVTNPGHFLTGPLTMQCMYAPEFRATSPAIQIEVRP